MIKQILRYVTAIVLTISIIVLTLVLLASSTIGNEFYILKKLDETSYYSNIYEEVKSSFENYIYQSGLDETVLESIITEEKVEKDTKTIISNMYNGLDENIEVESIKNNLNAKINELTKNTQLNVTQKQAIDTLVDKLCDEYTTTILHFTYEDEINNIYQKSMKYIDLAKKATMVLVAICIAILVALNIRRIYKFFNLVGISLISSGLFLIAINYIINSKIKIQAIIILNNAISITLRNILIDIFNKIVMYGSIFIGIGIIMVIISTLIHNIKKYKINDWE